MLNRDRIAARARKLREARDGLRIVESIVLDYINDTIEPGDAKPFALTLGVSPQYLCDVRAGRRGISDRLLAKLCERGE